MDEGYNKSWVQFTANNKVMGIACLNYDPSLLGGHRVYIRHLSTIVIGHFKTALETLLEYIWTEMPCDHCRVEILHLKDSEGNTKVDPDVKAAYAGCKFRWKTLTNDPKTGKRA